MAHIARGDRRLPCRRDAGNLNVADLDAPAEAAPFGSDPRRSLRGCLVDASSSDRRLRPTARISSPKRISKTVIDVVQIDSGGCESSQARTTGSV